MNSWNRKIRERIMRLNSAYFKDYKSKPWVVVFVFLLIFLHFYAMAVFPHSFMGSKMPLAIVLVLVFYIWALELKDKYTRSLIESVMSGVYITDPEGKLIFANQASAHILGYDSKEKIIGLNIARELYANPSDREAFLKELKEKGFVRNYEIELEKKDGSTAVLSTTSNLICGRRGDILGVQGVFNDVTERKKLEADLELERSKLEQILSFDEKISSIRKLDRLFDFIVERTLSILEAEKCSLMIVDDHNKELCIKGAVGLNEDIRRSAKIKFGDQIAGMVAQNGQPLLVTNIESDKRFQRKNRPFYSERSFMVVPIKLQDKSIGVINVADKKSGDDQSVFTEIDLKILCALVREVAVAIENVNLYIELQYLTVTDPLTHIHNYRQFTKSLDLDIKRSKRFSEELSLIMIDVDNFKSYNDVYGHVEGDEVLKGVGQILMENLREIDTVCRYAGDEFAIILPATDVDGARIAISKVNKVLEDFPFKRKVTLSAGIARYMAGLTRHEFVQKADMALYQAKKEGKNRICAYG